MFALSDGSCCSVVCVENCKVLTLCFLSNVSSQERLRRSPNQAKSLQLRNQNLRRRRRPSNQMVCMTRRHRKITLKKKNLVIDDLWPPCAVLPSAWTLASTICSHVKRVAHSPEQRTLQWYIVSLVGWFVHYPGFVPNPNFGSFHTSTEYL